MLDKLAYELQHAVTLIQSNLLLAFKLVGILWIIHVLNFITRYKFNHLGIQPRSWQGLLGIVFAPFLHKDMSHLFFNTVPLFVLADLALLDGPTVFYVVSGALIILSGSLVWLGGMRGIHIGASSLIMGYFGYLLARAYFQITALTLILAGVCLYYFGGLILAIFPGAEKNVSWEGHLFGLVAGIGVAYYLPSILQVTQIIFK